MEVRIGRNVYKIPVDEHVNEVWEEAKLKYVDYVIEDLEVRDLEDRDVLLYLLSCESTFRSLIQNMIDKLGEEKFVEYLQANEKINPRWEKWLAKFKGGK